MCFATPPVMRGRVVCECVDQTETATQSSGRVYTVLCTVGPDILRSLSEREPSARQADVMVRGRDRVPGQPLAQPFSFHGAGEPRGRGRGPSPSCSPKVAFPPKRAARGVRRTSHCDTGGSGRGSPAAQGPRDEGREGAPAWAGVGRGRGRKGTTLRQSSAELSPPTSHSRGRLRTDPTERISISHLRRARRSRTLG